MITLCVVVSGYYMWYQLSWHRQRVPFSHGMPQFPESCHTLYVLLASYFLVLKKCPDPNTHFLVSLLLHPVPLSYATRISLLQMFYLILDLFFTSKSNASCLFVLQLILKILACPDPNNFVPTLTPFPCTPVFPSKTF